MQTTPSVSVHGPDGRFASALTPDQVHPRPREVRAAIVARMAATRASMGSGPRRMSDLSRLTGIHPATLSRKLSGALGRKGSAQPLTLAEVEVIARVLGCAVSDLA